nr:unnamed protein product [Callosobruchus chinensis]
MSNRPISVVELERRRLATAASLLKNLEAITALRLKNMVEFNASKTQYCTLSNKRCPSEHSVLMNNQALPRSHSFKLLGVSITENMIWHEHVSAIATAAGKSSDNLFRARKYFSPSNLPTPYMTTMTLYCEAAYDTVPLNKLWPAMERNRISRPYINAAKKLYCGCESFVKVADKFQKDLRCPRD